ncbi:MAG: transposase [Burkholderiaceae bacterium]
MFAGKTVTDKSSLVRQAARLIVEEGLEAEAADALGGRGDYEHGADRRGYRNGNRLGRVKTAEGEIEFAVPQLAAMAEPFRSKIRNLQSKVPEEVWRELKGSALAADQAGSPKLAQMAKEDFVTRYEREYPSATACFLDDFDACIAHLQLPISHRRATRTTNLLERLFGEERRRTKVIAHAFGERAVLKLMYAALIRASQTWKNIVMTQFELRQLEQLREHLNERHVERTAPAVKSAPRSRISSNQRT